MSSNAIQAQGTKLYIATGSGGAKTITGAAPGNPTIITSAAHALVNGDVVTIAAIVGTIGTDATNGLNSKVFTVCNVTTNTFAVQANTVGLAYTSGGTATPTTFTQIKEVKSVKPSGASANKLDVTDLDSTAHEFKTGLQESGTVGIDYNALDSDAGQTALAAAFTGSLTKQYKITYPAGGTPNRTFLASVTKFSTAPEASVDGIIAGSAELQISGSVTVS